MPNTALLISNYNSQPREATFRLTRSMSGTFSSVVNFTTDQFLKRAGKLSILTELENKSDENSSEDDDKEDLPSISASGKYRFDGMRVINSVYPALSDSYFSVDIDGEKKYIHKQTACWLLTDSKDNLSADRLKRVQQSGR
ncbi:unnamed protein product [Rotaria magnacalcarata]|uniref:Uncharacterized protein n=1 Tax=Rotaria magnacalcarata TaxID=392030 RepID=A0A815YE91_9BILA|nr:unnamed protein product [Rotaria magnacalcarata]CAF4260250.1 unnamed protein product [Rotaria magnacalcarata]